MTLTAVRHHPSPETLLVHSEMLELSFSIAQAQHLDVSFINLHRIWNFTLLVQIPATALTALPTSHHKVGSNLELSKVIVYSRSLKIYSCLLQTPPSQERFSQTSGF